MLYPCISNQIISLCCKLILSPSFLEKKARDSDIFAPILVSFSVFCQCYVLIAFIHHFLGFSLVFPMLNVDPAYSFFYFKLFLRSRVSVWLKFLLYAWIPNVSNIS